jgi:predicted amidophosphoribosyltransferase
MTIYCKNCRKENSKTDKFCINCGSPLDIMSGNLQPLTQAERKIWSFRTDTWGFLSSSTMDGWGYMRVY